MIQPTLFDCQPNPRARRSDPRTSHIAAASMREAAADHRARIMQALGETTRPLSAEQISTFLSIDKVQVGRRMHELVRTGLVEVTSQIVKTSTGRPAQTYRRRSRP